jgi:acetyltransferase-like isoleucine patch superfamily enzyme
MIHATAIINGDVQLGDNASVGYFSIIRGRVRAGRNLRVGSHASIEGEVTIGDDVTIRGKCEIPNSIIGDRVNIYAGVKFYDTPNPPDGPNIPPIIEDDVTICCDAAILGGVVVGAGSFIGARVFLTETVPPNSYVTAKPEYTVQPRR